ncbi:AAA family ATPase [Candidatus Saccharibacteria bacterium]|nr:AAA family ATPase [Candidatus Saccharibacteria bacterium]
MIVIQGAPGSGKTTLAENLSRRLSYPIVSKDTLKEALGESLTVSTVADTNETAYKSRYCRRWFWNTLFASNQGYAKRNAAYY